MQVDIRGIGMIGNYYGGLNLQQIDDKYYWSIENYDGDNWDEIPKALYDMLVAYGEGKLDGN